MKAGKRAEKKAEKTHLYFKNDNKPEKKAGKRMGYFGWDKRADFDCT
ncbi:hypothetical protein MCJ35_17215 [Enterocloster sp. OA13]|nr:hypothetical protein [Enterocloster sp. OA13]